MTSKKILVVEDDKDLQMALDIVLTASGYEVCVAYDAIDAIATARKDKPDLIILDLGLPWGGGFLVMERLAATIPIVILTANIHPLYQKQAMKAGAKAFFQKPAKNELLLKEIERILTT